MYSIFVVKDVDHVLYMYVFYVPKHSLRGIFEHALAALYAKTVNRG